MDDEFNFNIDEEFSGPKKSTMPDLKKYIVPMIKIFILLAILFALIWFFFLRYTEISIIVKESDTGKTLNGGVIYLNDKVYDFGKPIKIIPGDYDIRLSELDARKYYLLKSELTIDKDSGDLELKAYPLEFKKLTQFTATLPSEIYENQLITLELNITNNNDSSTNIIIRGSNDLNALKQTFTLNTGINNLKVEFSNPKKKGTNLVGEIYIEGAKEINQLKKSINLKVNPAPVLKFKNLKTNYTVNAGQILDLTLEIDNSSTIEIKNLNLDFDNASIDKDILKSWVIEETKDLNIVAKGIGTAKISFLIPIDSTIKDEFFNITYKNSYAEVTPQKIVISIKNPEIITPKSIEFGKITAGQNLITKIITLENKTNFDVKIIGAKVNITTSQPNNLISTLEALFDIEYSDIPKNSSAEAIVNLIIPPTINGDNISGNIILITEYFEIKVPFKLEILELKIALDVLGINSKYTFTYPDGFTSKQTNNIVKLKNIGNIDLEIKSILISNTCPMLSTTIITPLPLILKPNMEQEFTFTLKSISKQNLTEEKVCSIDVIYVNPATNYDSTFNKIVIIS